MDAILHALIILIVMVLVISFLICYLFCEAIKAIEDNTTAVLDLKKQEDDDAK